MPKLTQEFTSSIPPARLFKAFVLDADNLFPKIAPNAVKSVEIIDGDGGAGTIKKITFGEVDKDNFVYAYSLIEGDALINKLKKISCENKFIAAEGGSIFKSVSKYHTKSDNHDIIEDKIKAGKEKVAHLFKVVEKYLQENPDAYN
ncbi:hypothetical protein FEM48_Zijuj07G0055500 [Ziziphus jujuba var. spinosa]|uniref:Bet v I/Major latex protein domain-containing protein n=1 Tax=Ziziphus jujuba var. spinosa TaxID=714518 RepID=A0A978V2R6_ZIZJJ|nr:hypothetical protein FEM48_Zijuj07G0055500 [Ziziphus jujuba var. spinosa]